MPETDHQRPGETELLAPAGDAACLDAALREGADAVYFGLQTMNARRGAGNFHHQELEEVMGRIHASNARGYLAVNIDLTPRETAQAARALEVARRAGVDAVLVRDPVFLRLRPCFPEIEFHWSTQAAVSASAGVRAAEALGIDRVVLARELTLDEIRSSAAASPAVGVEVFVQGALCMSVSGRCLLSSWAGGRSGNRGACASPCRAAWSVDGSRPRRILSMHDLSLIERLDVLRLAGVSALKIEGRLKTPDWVGEAVAVYRAALDGADPAELRERVEALGAYTGRKLVTGYLDGDGRGLTGESGRPAAAPHAEAETKAGADAGQGVDAAEGMEAFDVTVTTGGGRLEVTCKAAGHVEAWDLPLTVVKKARRALTIAQLGEWLQSQRIQGFAFGRFQTDEPDRLIPRKAANAIADRLSAALHRAKRGPETTIRVELPDSVREALRAEPASDENTRTLGESANALRIGAECLDAVLRQIAADRIIVDGLKAKSVASAAKRVGGAGLVAALPPVLYEGTLPRVQALVQACAEGGIPVEVNGWDGWRLARDAGAAMIAGPGMGLLNPLAVAAAADAGFSEATASAEIDRGSLEDLSAGSPLALSLIVYGRPVLAVTRAVLDSAVPAGAMLADARDVRMQARSHDGLTRFRPVDPFDWTDLNNARVRARWLVADLTGAEDPVMAWYALGSGGRKGRFRFNYDRKLF